MIRRVAAGLAAVAVLLTGCSDEPSIEAFCDAAAGTVEAGPLFPDRTDGEPVPEPRALEALQDLAAAAPDEVDASVDVLLREATALVADAEARLDASTSTTGTAATAPAVERPEREAVDAAQREVVAYVAAECEIDLTDRA